MANELSVNIQTAYANGSDSHQASKGKLITVGGISRISNIQNIGFAAEETLAKGDITTVGVVMVHNMDATNYVTVGGTTTVRPIKVKAGEVWTFRLDATNVFIQANAAGCNVYYELYES